MIGRKTYKYIYIEVLEDKPKTKVYGVFNNRTNSALAEIKWYSPWREYCIFYFSDTVFNLSCSQDIVDFLSTLKAERKW